MTREEIIDNLELYTVGRPKKDRVSFTVEELQNLIDEIKVLEQQPSDDCVSRQEVIRIAEQGQVQGFEWQIKKLVALPPVTPTHGTCKDCKHWKDSDGVYRRGIGAESKCPINIKEVYEGNFYCKDFEKRGNENESIN